MAPHDTKDGEARLASGSPAAGPAPLMAPLFDPSVNPWAQGVSYAVDAWQRGILFLDVLRQRGNQYHEHMAQRAPNVLRYDAELVMDGRKLERPVNYGLVRVLPPEGVEIDPLKRPFIVFDPRAGNAPGIGGFKADSELGVAMRAGHPCYFVGFLPWPLPGQTLEDVVIAETLFVERVGELHSESDGKPVVIGNCQAGWQVMMAAALRPELFGPIIIAGAPLSYWAGTPGGSPMRYLGGLLGGTWMTALAGDLGNGIFDGAYLVQNFEALNPANTIWTKQYHVYANIDTEPPRYLEFERWWGSHVLMNAGEMQTIVDDLFVGNRLSTAEITMSDGTVLDLRNIRSPVIVFCSKGDNITPPPQALGWITDLYGSLEEIRANGQTIVYAVHESVGHLGIFVSGSVARKEHQQFATNIDMIDVLPPGLYEAELERRLPGEPGAELVRTDYISRFAGRDLDDIRAIVGGGEEEDRRFAAVAQLSRINLGLYRTYVQPAVRAASNEATADWLRRTHPLRLGYEMFSDHNPFLRMLEPLAEQVRENRRPAAPDNPFLAMQQRFSDEIVRSLDLYGEMRDTACERFFEGFYGSAAVQAALGMRADNQPPRRRPGLEPERRQLVRQRAAELHERIAEGGLPEALIRSMLYVGLAERAADQRSFELLRQMRRENGYGMDLPTFKAVVRMQFFMLLLDPEKALATLPQMLAGTPGDVVEQAMERLRAVLTVGEPLSSHAEGRLETIERIFHTVAGEGRHALPSASETARAIEGSAAIAEQAPDEETVAADPAEEHPGKHKAAPARRRRPRAG